MLGYTSEWWGEDDAPAEETEEEAGWFDWVPEMPDLTDWLPEFPDVSEWIPEMPDFSTWLPDLGGGDEPVSGPTEGCPYADEESEEKKSLFIDIGWAFTGSAPGGTYELSVAGKEFSGELSGGKIRIVEELDSLCGDGELLITAPDGTLYKAALHLDLPNIQEVEGIKRRLTNLGYYAGTNATLDGRAAWAIRAFKRKQMNSFKRGSGESGNSDLSDGMVAALMNAYTTHLGDNPSTAVKHFIPTANYEDCGLFGPRGLRRGSFELSTLPDDKDPTGSGDNGIWWSREAHWAQSPQITPIAGIYDLYLRAFDPAAGQPEMINKVCLPQSVRMTQFVLFELGFWLINNSNRGGAQTLDKYTPTGEFDRKTQWSVREFQCYAKCSYVPVEDVDSTESLHLKRLLSYATVNISSTAGHYPGDGKVSGAMNDATRTAMQKWADNAWRCPVVAFATTDETGQNLGSITCENIWNHDDCTSSSPRMFAIDFSSYYDIPAAYDGSVSSGGYTFPKPIVMGYYVSNAPGGGVTFPWRGHSWGSADAEVRPETLVDPADPGDGSSLSAAELSTFKIIRTASHFECLGYLDAFNAYDGVTISFGTCHWTLAWCSGSSARAQEEREMPAMLAYFRQQSAGDYFQYFGRFGLYPLQSWPRELTDHCTYVANMGFQTETVNVILCGAQPQASENNYCKTWHSFYRFQMACRVSRAMREAMWDFARFRVRDLLDQQQPIGTNEYRIGDYATSEKAVAMIHRWHILRPADIAPRAGGGARMRNAIAAAVALGADATPQAREDRFIQELVTQSATSGATDITTHIPLIESWSNIPQSTTINGRAYDLSLADPALSSTAGSFNLADP